MIAILRFLIVALLLTSSSVLAAPTAEQAKALVEGVIAWSLPGAQAVKLPVQWDVVSQHKEEFAPELLQLLEWVGTPHKDADGRDWHYDLEPLWQVQGSGVTSVRVGSPKAEGEVQLVAVDYVSPSGISATRPSTRYHNVWVVAEHNGKPVISDIRYHIKYPQQTNDGNLMADLRKTKANFKAP